MGAPSLLPTTIKLTCVLSQQRVSDKTCNMSMNTAWHCNALKRERATANQHFYGCGICTRDGDFEVWSPFGVAQDRAKPNTSICIGEEPYYAMPRHKFVSCHRHLQTCKSQFSFSVEPRLLCMRYNVMCLSEGSLFRGPLRTASLFMKGSAIKRQDIKQHHMRGQMRDGEFLLQKSNTTCSTTKNVEMLKEVSPE